MSFSRDQVQAAVNRACDDVLDAVAAGDEGVRDLANLLVNASLYYLDEPGASLRDAIEACYEAEPEEVLGWCRT